MDADVSVIVPARRAEPFLDAALASILLQRPRPAEVLVCTPDLDGPSALTAMRIGGPVRVVCGDGDDLAAKLNLGLGQSRGTWTAFLDADDAWPEPRLRAALAAFVAEPGLDVCLGHQLAMTADGVLGRHPRPAPLLGATLLRRAAAQRIGPFAPPDIGSGMDWLVRARDRGLRFTTLDDVLLHRRVHPGNLSRRREDLHAGYLQTVRASLRRRAGAET